MTSVPGRDPDLIREAIVLICLKIETYQANNGVDSHHPAPIPRKYSVGDQLLETVKMVRKDADGKLRELCVLLEQHLEQLNGQ